MNRRMILYMVGQVCEITAVLMVLPLIVSILYRERCLIDFLLAITVALVIGLALTFLSRPTSKVIYAKEGYIIVGLSWIVVSAIGALPFYFSQQIPHYIDAFFETVSGFTTTGASILTDVEAMSKGLLFWRSFTHWIGGMGVLVFLMAVVPLQNDRGMHIARAEMPGPTVGKLMPRLRDTARVLYLIYAGMSVIMVIFELAGGMPFFDSLLHMFGAAGTGGFGIKSDSIASYSPYEQWVITIFMLLFGVNFNLYYLCLHKHFKEVLESDELKTYLALFLISSALITINTLSQNVSVATAIRNACFQVSSIMTTTGYATTDFNKWPEFSKGILMFLMLIGACAGSTGGGLKVSRLVMLAKNVKRELRHLIHPRSVGVVRFEGRTVDDQTLHSVSVYLALYMGILIAVALLLSLDRFDFETNLSAANACFNNIGPGLGAVGPASSYAGYSPFSKLVLCAAMLLGRLEIYPLFLMMTPSIWSRSS